MFITWLTRWWFCVKMETVFALPDRAWREADAINPPRGQAGIVANFDRSITN